MGTRECEDCKHNNDMFFGDPRCRNCYSTFKRPNFEKEDNIVNTCDNCKYEFLKEDEGPCANCQCGEEYEEAIDEERCKKCIYSFDDGFCFDCEGKPYEVERKDDKMNKCTCENLDWYEQCPYCKGDKDNVNFPDHYVVGGIETLDYIKAKFEPKMYEGFLVGNIIKYVSRYQYKNGREDLKKAQFYLNKAIEYLEG